MIHHITGSVCLVGDIHGEYQPIYPSDFPETPREKKIADNYILLGDIGFGFYKLSVFLKRLDKAIPKGANVYFIRGNHDNPDYWKLEQQEVIKKIISRFTMVQDYDALVIGGKTFVCVGGGISIDRHFRDEGKSYWSGEVVMPPPSKNVYGEVYGILSHTGFTPPVMTHKHAFQMRFPDVNKECMDEQNVLYDILHLYKPQVWYNGHYHVHCNFRVEDCYVHDLDICEHQIIQDSEHK